MNIQFAGKTDVGMKRTHNEDSLKLIPKERLFIVADGMGGHASGEVASNLAVEAVGEFFDDTSRDRETTWPYREEQDHDYEENRLIASIKLANLRIFEKAESEMRYKGMGTTIVGLQLLGSHVIIGHVGDSRAYRLREDRIEQLTEDHSLLNDYKKMTTLTPEEEKNFPHKNIIVRALGMKATVQVDILRDSPQPNDIYLLCSDGLSGEVEDPEMLSIVRSAEGNLQVACERLIRAACDHGGKDNVTAVLVQVLP